ncbi:TPA: hypothetical protein L6B10_16890 [Pseudomonas aeruginosa]|nr:hypothetical protein [Pseudomonas aeruginosa]
MPGIIFRKGTLLILSGPVDHLHIVMNDPIYSHEHGWDGVLAVNISSVKDGIFHDPTCVLTPGCHPFVVRDSWVVYREAVVMRCERLENKYQAGEIREHDPVSDGVFDRVRAGFDSSRMVSPKIHRFIRNHQI